MSKISYHHRVVKHVGKNGPWYGVHEIYLTEGGGIKWSKDPVKIAGDSLEEIKAQLEILAANIGNQSVLVVDETEKLIDLD